MPPFGRHFERGICGQGNGDKGIVAALVDALVGIPDLGLLGVEGWGTALPKSPSSMTNEIAIFLSPFPCPKNMRKEVWRAGKRKNCVPPFGRRFERGICGQGNGDKGMVAALVDALFGVPDLGLLGVEGWDTALPKSPSSMTNEIAIHLSPFPCPKNMRKEV